MVKTAEIRDFVRSLVAQFRPERVILFGSYAKGRPRPDSDVDMLVVLDFKGKNLHKAVEIIATLQPRFGVDLILKTPKQIDERLRSHDIFLKDVTRNGKVLYEASHA